MARRAVVQTLLLGCLLSSGCSPLSWTLLRNETGGPITVLVGPRGGGEPARVALADRQSMTLSILNTSTLQIQLPNGDLYEYTDLMRLSPFGVGAPHAYTATSHGRIFFGLGAPYSELRVTVDRSGMIHAEGDPHSVLATPSNPPTVESTGRRGM